MGNFSFDSDVARQAWMRAGGLLRLFSAIEAGGGEARVVGGAVRDALIGCEVRDVDLAVNLPPEKVVAILSAAGIRTVPTGIEHGTVTAVVDHTGYELTSLRRDVESFGRQARVEFTDDWKADASRRDFTFNALYLDSSGRVYDYFGGRKDLEFGLVRFIGDARGRIQEDVLRILRFFRFYAWLGRGDPDAEGLAACCELSSLLPKLSVERVWREIVKLLAAANPVPSWNLMLENGVLASVLPEADHVMRLERLIILAADSDPLLRLASLLPWDVEVVSVVARRLKLSRREALSLQGFVGVALCVRSGVDLLGLRRLVYGFGVEAARGAVLLVASEGGLVDRVALLSAVDLWESPVFPLKGRDLLALGVSAGAGMGAVLRDVEAWWVEGDFQAGFEACLGEAKRLVG